MKISIAIPTYEYNGKGEELLEFSFRQMEIQTFKDFDVVISDHSEDSTLETLCNKWKDKLDIKYFKNPEKRGNPASNLNSAIRNSTGEWIKILCQDDYLMYEDSLEKTYSGFIDSVNWMATSYIHTKDKLNYFGYHCPVINPNLLVVNTIGTPSCVAIRNLPNIPEVDENLKYAYDCEFYFRFWKQYGVPKFLVDVTIANYIWENSMTSKISEETIEKENSYILKKHGISTSENKPT